MRWVRCIFGLGGHQYPRTAAATGSATTKTATTNSQTVLGNDTRACRSATLKAIARATRPQTVLLLVRLYGGSESMLMTSSTASSVITV